MDKAERQGRRPLAAIIGSARDGSQGEDDAYALGGALIDAGFRIVTGGMGGIMAAASLGARGSARYIDGDIIGILPGYDARDANVHVDIPICTGLQHGRNLLVAATGDVVFALAGRSGTLSEIAFAWTLGKPVICVGDAPGWASRLAGEPIDDRREDRVYGPLRPQQAVELATQLLQALPYRPKEF